MLVQIKPAEKNILRAYVKPDSKRSKKLACIILNSLIDKYPFLNPVIELSSDQILEKAPVSLILEIDKSLQDQETIEEIAKAFEGYYE